MNILITAGGTSEPIDEVRTITNSATGRLGSLIATQFASLESTDKVYYVCSHSAIKPECDKVEIVYADSTADLQNTLTRLLTEESIDAIIHSMAVSDYRTRAVLTLEDMREISVCEDFEEKLCSKNLCTDGKKLSSYIENPVIVLEKTPKIISMLRELAPQAVIVGFKLLSNVSREELFEVAHRLLLKNSCDFVLANDGAKIKGDTHKGYLLDKDMNYKEFDTKQDIAKGITSAVMEGMV